MKKLIVTIYCLVLLAALVVCGYAYAATGDMFEGPDNTRDMTWSDRVI